MNFDNTNSGALFKADKQGNDKRPDYSGTLNVDGREYFLSAWLKSSKAGQKYMSLAVKPKGERKAAPPPPKDDVSFPDDDLADLPF